MPKLLSLLMCDRVLVTRDDAVSLISIFDVLRFDLPTPPKEGLPPKANIPVEWYIYSMWAATEGDAGKEYEQRFTIIGADGVKPFEAFLDFTQEGHSERTVVSVNGFPIMQPGICHLRLDLREKGEDEWREIASYPLEIAYRDSI